MKAGFYPKLAVDGIRKNKRLYIPYLLTCIGMTAMHYIIAFLAETPLLSYLPGSDTIQSMMAFGTVVLEIFSVIFLFYTNSFLIRRRKKEFGLYNILGMDKWNIGRILFWETALDAAITLTVGLGLGIAFSKFAELGMVNIMKGEAFYTLSVSVEAVARTALVFGGIFLLLLLNTLRQVRISNPVALLRSESAGEKPPKANWLLGILGAILLGGAYYLAVSIQDPITAISLFFVAVVMVILASYLLFVSGSVVLCRILQKNKRYYYRANHFISTSSMAYRMKRNGAGLASICILITMVLVMISSSACLYFGEEDSLRTRYPRDIMSRVGFESLADLQDENVAQLRESMERIRQTHGADAKQSIDYRYAVISGLLVDGSLEADVRDLSDFSYGKLTNVLFVPLADYNSTMGTAERLEENQVLLYFPRGAYKENTFSVLNGPTFQVKAVLDTFCDNGLAAMDALPTLFVVVPDLESSISGLMSLADYKGEPMVQLQWLYGYDTDAGTEVQCAIVADIKAWQEEMQDAPFHFYELEVRDTQRADFYGTYGGIFFLGIMLSIVFLFAAVLIIYYKQISEGYEDQSRFEIMQKVGMTKKDIRRSINSQMLTVFFLPLVTAVVHLCFAFPLIRKLLMLFNMTNVNLFLITTGISILVFGLFYALVYKITSNAYYAIVSGIRKTGHE